MPVVVSLDEVRRARATDDHLDVDTLMRRLHDQIRHVTAQAVFIGQAHGREIQALALLEAAVAHARSVLGTT